MTETIGPVTLNLCVKVAWWVRWYLLAVAIVAWLTYSEPDMNKVEKVVMRGLKVDVK